MAARSSAPPPKTVSGFSRHRRSNPNDPQKYAPKTGALGTLYLLDRHIDLHLTS